MLFYHLRFIVIDPDVPHDPNMSISVLLQFFIAWMEVKLTDKSPIRTQCYNACVRFGIVHLVSLILLLLLL